MKLINSNTVIGDSFGKEAREALVAFMENNRDRFCLIVAGYPAPMEKFLSSNPGFSSRFSNTIHFDDYTESELLDIFHLMVEKRNRTIGIGLDVEVYQVFQDWLENANSSFGNARDVRNLVDQMCANLDNRLVKMDLSSMDPSDPALRRLEVIDLPKRSD